MQKNHSKRTLIRRIRQCAAIFVSIAALWLIWLTSDPLTLIDQVDTLADDVDFSMTLLSTELGPPDYGQLSMLERMVLNQSPFLSYTPEPDTLTPPPIIHTEEPQVDRDELEEDPPPATTTAPEGIIGKTMVAGTSSKYISQGSISIYNHTDYPLDINALLAAAPTLTAQKDGPQVLIFHSHATEAYTMDGSDIYEESDSYRTLDTERNMVRIGREMVQILEAAGIEVIHDTTLFDYPSYNEAYTRSAKAVAQWLEQYPSIQLVIDVHRDALAASDGTIYKTVAGTLDNCAQVMMVMGTDATGQKHPNWRVNLSLAVSIQKALTDNWATLARPIVLRTSRFNQHQSTGEILLEVGSHGNTLQEAITAARLFARTIVGMIT